MKKTNLVISLLLFVVLLNCSGDKTELTKKEVFIEGVITKVGNEPFSELVIQVHDSTSYIMECDKAMTDSLSKQQGEFYRVYYTKKIVTQLGEKITILKVERIIK